MIAGNILSHDVVPLKTSDSGKEALAIMGDYYIQHLPIVNNEQLLGLISETDILDHDVEEAVGSYQLSLRHPYVKESEHIYEALRVFHEFKLTIVPVIDADDNYKGMITQHDLLQFFVQTGSFTEPGAVIVLDMLKRDYSLAEISRIVEQEQANILSSYITSSMSAERIDVTLKINRQEISRILAAFERYEYQVKASFQEGDYFDSFRDRYDSFINYLNI